MVTTKKIVKDINEKTENLSVNIGEIIDMLNKMRSGAIQKAEKYDETLRLLKKVKINVKKFSTELKDNATVSLKIEYEIPPIEIMFDETGCSFINERFQAMNLLNLISFDDMRKIQEQLHAVEAQNKKISGK